MKRLGIGLLTIFSIFSINFVVNAHTDSNHAGRTLDTTVSGYHSGTGTPGDRHVHIYQGGRGYWYYKGEHVHNYEGSQAAYKHSHGTDGWHLSTHTHAPQLPTLHAHDHTHSHDNYQSHIHSWSHENHGGASADLDTQADHDHSDYWAHQYTGNDHSGVQTVVGSGGRLNPDGRVQRPDAVQQPANPPPNQGSNPPPPANQHSSPSTQPETVEEVIEQIEQDIETPPEDIEVLEPDEPPEPEPVLERWTVHLRRGWNMVTFPVLPEGVDTISSLYHYKGWPLSRFNARIITYYSGQWVLYTGPPDDVAGEIPLTANHALIIHVQEAVSISLYAVGQHLSGRSSVEVVSGINGIGLTELPVTVERPSDLLSNTISVVLVEQDGDFYLVGRVGDTGDALLRKGQAVFVFATGDGIVSLGDVPSAPSAYRVLTTSWGRIKKGSN